MIPKLAVLGLLQKKDMHGYEIIKRINDEMTNFCDIKIGSIYFAINDLKKKEFIEFKGKIEGKKEPDKSIYGITEKGREEFSKLLKKSLLKPYAGRYPIDLAIHFRETLSETEFNRIISDKKYICERVVHALEESYKNEENETTKLILKHQILHQKAELEWLNFIFQNND